VFVRCTLARVRDASPNRLKQPLSPFWSWFNGNGRVRVKSVLNAYFYPESYPHLQIELSTDGL